MRRALRSTDRFVLAAWGVSLLGGLGALVHHGVTPGDAGTVPDRLPPSVAERLGGNGGLPLVVLCAHPQCPCLPSTLTELERVLATAPPHRLCILAYAAKSPAANWDPSRDTELARRFGAARMVADLDGKLAEQLGARTSGHVLLFAEDGTLRFSGGVTAGRGHVGENAAARALAGAMADTGAPRETTHIFGCPLAADTGSDGDQGLESF